MFSRRYGSGASNLVEAQVVLADGQIVTTSECNEYSDLHWAIRGGGSGFGALVTQATYLTFPEPSFGKIWSPIGKWGAQTKEDMTSNIVTFITWYKNLAATGEIKHFGGSVMIKDQNVRVALSYVDLPQDDCERIVKSLNLVVANPCEQKSFDDAIYSAWRRECDTADGTEDAAWCTSDPGRYLTHSLQRYVLPEHVDSASKIQAIAATFVDVQDGCLDPDAVWRLRLNYNLGSADSDVLDRSESTSVHPQVSDSLFNFGLVGYRRPVGPESVWGIDTAVEACHQSIVDALDEIVPGAGQYVNEGDIREPNWQESFWGDNYPGLLSVKEKYDPLNVFQCHKCVGNEDFDKCYSY